MLRDFRSRQAECAIAAQCQTINPDDVPRSREAVIEFFDDWRPRLAASALAQSMTRMILHPELAMPAVPEVTAPIMSMIGKYMRQMFGIKQSAVEDKIVQNAMRALMTAVNSNMHLYDAVWSWLVPGTAPIMMPAVLGIPALSDVTMTPREAQKKYGYDIPSEAHMDLRRKQEQRAFGSHEAPSDEGLIESEAFFGGMKGVVAATG
nr:oxygenase MpaB family protein [Antrihabitans stalactiti]